MSETLVEPHPSQAAGQTTNLEASLWRMLSGAPDRVAFARAWLALQCRAVDGATQGLVTLKSGEDQVFEPIATWPEGAGKLPNLVEGARKALVEKVGIVSGSGSRGDRSSETATSLVIAYPLIVDGAVEGAVALSLSGLAVLDPREALRDLQWGVAGLRENVHQARIVTDRKLLERSRAALNLLSVALDRNGFTAAALGVATEVAMRFNVSRASIGFVERGSARVKIISHTAQFRRQMNLVARVQGAMNESIDQRCIVLYPSVVDQRIATSAHAELSRLERDANLLTIPIFKSDRFVGAMTFERPKDEPFDTDMVQLLEAVTATTGALLEEQRQNDRWIISKIGSSAKRQVVRLLGPSYLTRKLVVAALIAVTAFFYVAKGEYRVDADAQLEGIVRRAVVASYDGFLRDANVRAGDTVKKGEVLAALDDRDLALERLRWVTDRQQRLYEYDKALATHQPAAINVVRSQIDQAEAQIKLIDEQLSRLTVVAPIDGLVISGDLSQLIGASINRGQMLFEIAPLDSYRTILSVDERQISALTPGQTGELVTNALPNERFAFIVEKITPIAEAKSGRNTFRVEGRLTQNSPRLRPGMEGVAKIDIGPRRIIWIWTRSLIDWLRIASWQWLG